MLADRAAYFISANIPGAAAAAAAAAVDTVDTIQQFVYSRFAHRMKVDSD